MDKIYCLSAEALQHLATLAEQAPMSLGQKIVGVLQGAKPLDAVRPVVESSASEAGSSAAKA